MNTRTLRRKRVLVPAVAVVALGVGGTVWAGTASADQVGGGERDRVSAAALRTVGEGRVTSVETSDDRGEAYEVEVTRADGTEVDVVLDDELGVVGREDDRADGDRDDRTDRDDVTDDDGTTDRDDRVLSATERDRAAAAAEEAVGGGTATDVEASDDRGTAYDVEVRATDGTEWDVDLDDAFAVVDQREDR
ncbi:PepSY domain-containing protein [Nocardioides aurantiacus]|uniref:Peptidase YpeB-like protein n=1 Tax=Nocardioides aurantiacus TaxID=86796 RepID=A0A3N2CYX6_9ACTN|nr:PepSY domain-containing protein [Nocardioides aurantiacus]ROR92663.1 peptidase YpeB-like protein [Nocardioides aurantiacus]